MKRANNEAPRVKLKDGVAKLYEVTAVYGGNGTANDDLTRTVQKSERRQKVEEIFR